MTNRGEALLVPGSVYECPRPGEHLDHCAVSADFLLLGR
jgi:hypothetical protein